MAQQNEISPSRRYVLGMLAFDATDRGFVPAAQHRTSEHEARYRRARRERVGSVKTFRVIAALVDGADEPVHQRSAGTASTPPTTDGPRIVRATSPAVALRDEHAPDDP